MSVTSPPCLSSVGQLPLTVVLSFHTSSPTLTHPQLKPRGAHNHSKTPLNLLVLPVTVYRGHRRTPCVFPGNESYNIFTTDEPSRDLNHELDLNRNPIAVQASTLTTRLQLGRTYCLLRQYGGVLRDHSFIHSFKL